MKIRLCISIMCLLLSFALLFTGCGSTGTIWHSERPHGINDMSDASMNPPSKDSSTANASNNNFSTSVGEKTTGRLTSRPTTVSGTTASKGRVTSILVDGTPLEGFTQGQYSYTYVLSQTASKVPQITVQKSNGAGKLTVTQADSDNGIASVSLNGETYTIQFRKRQASSMLNNTYYKLKKDKKLNIAYFGGSVTGGYGSTNAEIYSWRAKTTAWFQTQFPDAQITALNAAIGGTGSHYGAYRVVKDLKLQDASKRPDLCFIEFAINDYYDGTQTGVYVESIIRTIYQYAPYADIVLVFTTDISQKNTDYTAVKAQKQLADAYMLPFVSVGTMLWEHIVEEKGSMPSGSTDPTWKMYFTDIVHPTDAGYAMYAKYVTDYVGELFLEKETVPTSLVKAYMPAISLLELPVNPHIINLEGQEISVPGFRVTSEGYIVKDVATNPSFSFDFIGTELKAWVYATPRSGSMRVSIDGNKAIEIDMYRRSANHTLYTIASGLSAGKHTAKVTVMRTDNGDEMQLRYFLVSGSKLEGMTINNLSP